MKLPDSWIVLRALIERAVGPTCLVGGALRDLDNGRPVKDLDFFVFDTSRFLSSDRNDRFRQYEAALREGVPGLEVVNTIDPEYAEAFRDEVQFVWSCVIPGFEHEVQVILIDQPAGMIEVARRVDFGLCMIGWDGAELYRAPEYLKDQRQGSFTLYRADNETNHRRSLARFDRFTVKYPEHFMLDQSAYAKSSPKSEELL